MLSPVVHCELCIWLERVKDKSGGRQFLSKAEHDCDKAWHIGKGTVFRQRDLAWQTISKIATALP